MNIIDAPIAAETEYRHRVSVSDASPPLDKLNRPLRDLRLSVIDQCNFRCTYCMPRDTFGPDYPFLPSAQRLSFEQMVKLAKAFALLGVEKIRITGGEPLLRRGLEALRREVLGGEENTIARGRADEQEHGEEAEEFEDEAQGMAQDEVNQALRNANDRRIQNIQRALQKIADGTYGFSDASGDPIPKARLEAVPEAIFTVEEESRRETNT